MKKFGYFLLIFLPLIIAEAIQIFAIFYSMGVVGIASIIKGGISFSSFIDILSALLLDANFNSFVMIIYSLISICIFGLWYYIKFEADYLPFMHHRFKPQNLISLSGVILLVPGAQFAASMICAIMMYVTPNLYKQYEELMETAGLDTKMTFIIFVYSVILAPICEELIFRGVTLSSAKRIMPFWLANIIQALLFGLFHFNWVQGVYAFSLGLLLGFICEKGKSIYFSLALHFLFNLWAAVLSELISSNADSVALGLIMILVAIVSLSVGLILFNLGIKKRNNSFSTMPS